MGIEAGLSVLWCISSVNRFQLSSLLQLVLLYLVLSNFMEVSIDGIFILIYPFPNLQDLL